MVHDIRTWMQRVLFWSVTRRAVIGMFVEKWSYEWALSWPLPDLLNVWC